MKTTWMALVGCAVLATTSGCVIAPLPYHRDEVARERVYVEPAYASPGAGWVWVARPSHGWGWHHHRHGWHHRRH